MLQNSSFEPSRSFHIKLGQDAVLVPKYIHMASQNAPKSGLGGVLEPSWRPLGPSWKHHEASWGHLGASRTYLGASWAILEASWRRLGASKSTDTVGGVGAGPRWRVRRGPSLGFLRISFGNS